MTWAELGVRAGLGVGLIAAAYILRYVDGRRRRARRLEAVARATAREGHPSVVGRLARRRHDAQ